MAETSSGIWYPGKTELVSPLEANFSTMASSIQNVFEAIYPMKFLTGPAEITALREGTPFYVQSWGLSGIKTSAAGSTAYRMLKSGVVTGVYNANGFSGGALVPGASAIYIATQKNVNYASPYNAKFEVNVTLKIDGVCAGDITLLGQNGASRVIRWHSYGNSGLYNVSGSLEVNSPPADFEFFIAGKADAPSQTNTQILNVSSSITTSV